MPAINFVSGKKIKEMQKSSKDFNYDLGRMKSAMSSSRVEIPEGLTKEQLRQFIVSNK